MSKVNNKPQITALNDATSSIACPSDTIYVNFPLGSPAYSPAGYVTSYVGGNWSTGGPFPVKEAKKNIINIKLKIKNNIYKVKCDIFRNDLNMGLIMNWGSTDSCYESVNMINAPKETIKKRYTKEEWEKISNLLSSKDSTEREMGIEILISQNPDLVIK